MRFEVDIRENILIQEIEKDDILKSKMTKKQLDLGDIIIYDDNNNISLLIERKTPSDLMSSIKDGRYNEQSTRLASLNLHNHNIIYLMEGNYMHHRDYNTILSAMFSIYYYKGFSIWQSINVKTTKELICKFMNKLDREKGKTSFYEKTQNSIDQNYTQCIKTVKKDNVTLENIHEIMLMQIPNVSNVIAKVVLSEYKTIFDLKYALCNDSQCLNSMKYKTSTGQERKISSLAIKNIIHFLSSEHSNHIYE
jgi:ERCC4-type nuclease